MVRSTQIKNFTIRLLDSDPTLVDQFNACGYPLSEEVSHIDTDKNGDPLLKYSLPGIYWKEVWDTWYDPSVYGSIVVLLYCFPYHTELVLRGLLELTCHSQRHNVGKLASLEALPEIIGILKLHWDDKAVVTQAVSTLSRASDHDANLAVLEVVPDLMPTLIVMLEEFGQSTRILQWALYVLLNLVSKASNCEANKDTYHHLWQLRT
eukprot:TRINITY_DN232_c0_g1_i15.p1 TRINITY_DN232_c0_g1~~TRINITY_DN232_c0_g1_i15.p1  ORF type:complete len:207 (-),score=37.06 TRINITY_DN232_c0_g1_i15:305-925(-)